MLARMSNDNRILVQVSHFWRWLATYALMHFSAGRWPCKGGAIVTPRKVMSASTPDFGILSGAYKPNRHQGKEADPWNLPLRSSI
jgi:hypothetical protein